MFPARDQFSWLESHARRVVEHCRRVAPTIPGFAETPVPFYVPGGDDKYPSFWVRDFVMQCRSGCIPLDEMRTLLRLILHNQNGPRRRDLANGLRVDPWAIPDHINLPGVGDAAFHERFGIGAVYFPGSYDPSDNQGTGVMGLRPADDDIYETVDLARMVMGSGNDREKADFLRWKVKDVSVFERLSNGMQAMTVHPESGLCWNRPDNWAAASFHDGLKPMGMVAITSCYRFRAARTMAEFSRLLGDPEQAKRYEAMAETIAASLARHCRMPSGWLMASTEVNRQPDVWSTSMAVCFGILQGEAKTAACNAMLKAYRDGSVARFGYLRHIPIFADAVPGESLWVDGSEMVKLGFGVYQNGGYWPQPVGYYVFALAQVDREAALQMAREFIDHTRARAEAGAPFEWINPDLDPPRQEGRWYGPSAALPLEAFKGELSRVL
ncbi:MAG: hypothetical protein PHR35_19970 [Kiritimatiellae bacterium]|nr:hypothetical protein [Kiritimatiellia bacterium]